MAGKARTLRWTFEMAGAEYGIDRRVVATRAKTAGIVAGSDGKYTTKAIASAIFGDIQGEVLRKTREEADRLALENEKRRGTLVEAESVYKTYESVFVVLRQKILASTLTDDEKDELLNELRNLKTRTFTE